MISWSIAALLDSQCFDRVVVSTDDEEIAEVAISYGAEAPFVRPSALSDDYTSTGAVIRHAVQWFYECGTFPEQVCCAYATAPFMRADDILQGLNKLTSTGLDYAFSITSYPFPIQRAIRVNSQDQVEMFNPENLNTRSQDLEPAYHDAAQFYWGKAAAWLAGKPIFGMHSSAVKIPRYRTQDIDTLEDWQMAEYMFRAINFNTIIDH